MKFTASKPTELVEELLAERFVVELYRDRVPTGRYYVADDVELTTDINKALDYPTLADAKAEAKLNNIQWEIDGEFVAVSK
jgi:hypothetical protein